MDKTTIKISNCIDCPCLAYESSLWFCGLTDFFPEHKATVNKVVPDSPPPPFCPLRSRSLCLEIEDRPRKMVKKKSIRKTKMKVYK